MRWPSSAGTRSGRTIGPLGPGPPSPYAAGVTEVNGLRLAYRGFIGGLAASYAWLALAMVLSGLLVADPLAPLRPMASALSPAATSAELAFVLGLLLTQAGGGLAGICFAYFFARFFTVRRTLLVAAASYAVLSWALVQAAGLGVPPAVAPATVVAALGYGLLLGVGTPLRSEVLRTQSPVT